MLYLNVKHIQKFHLFIREELFKCSWFPSQDHCVSTNVNLTPRPLSKGEGSSCTQIGELYFKIFTSEISEKYPLRAPLSFGEGLGVRSKKRGMCKHYSIKMSWGMFF
jgi:hypothetical protein